MAKYKKRTDGRYYERIQLGKGPNGKYKYKYLYGDTQKELTEKIAAFQADLQIYGRPLDKNTLCFSDWMREHLFTNVKPNVKPSTFETYMSIYNIHIEGSDFGSMRLTDIRQIDFQRFINEKKHLSKAFLKKIRFIIKTAFAAAIDNNLIRVNPIENVKLPMSNLLPKSIEILTIEEQSRYMKELQYGNRTTNLMCLTALHTGMRISEIIGLRWDNVDLIDNKITVCEIIRSVRVYNNDGTYYTESLVSSTKTETSNRIIPITNTLARQLKAYQKECFPSKNNLVFATKNGNHFISAYVRRKHREVCERAKIRPYFDASGDIQYGGITFHGLRHTFATRLIESGIDVKTVSEILGHKNVMITLNTYVHSTEDSKLRAMESLENLYRVI